MTVNIESFDAIATGEAAEAAKLLAVTAGLRVWLTVADVAGLAVRATQEVQSYLQADLSAYNDQNCSI